MSLTLSVLTQNEPNSFLDFHCCPFHVSVIVSCLQVSRQWKLQRGAQLSFWEGRRWQSGSRGLSVCLISVAHTCPGCAAPALSLPLLVFEKRAVRWRLVPGRRQMLVLISQLLFIWRSVPGAAACAWLAASASTRLADVLCGRKERKFPVLISL